MASTAASISARLALLGLVLACCASLLIADHASAEEATTQPAEGQFVAQLGADPTVSVARHRHCVRTKVRLAPRYTGGGGLTATYLYVNGEQVAERRSIGHIRISAAHLERGLNSYELISEFADGRAASVTGSLRRCR